MKEFRKTRTLPAFRVVESFECEDLLPVHFLNEDKALQDGCTAAMHYMLLVCAIVLHERLLVLSLAEDTLNNQQFRLKDSHRVFFMTCCGHIATLHEMRLRDIWTLPNPSDGRSGGSIGVPRGPRGWRGDASSIFWNARGERAGEGHD